MKRVYWRRSRTQSR